MSSSYLSLTLALEGEVVPVSIGDLNDIGPLFQPDNGLVTSSRSNWLCGALWRLCSHFKAKPLSFLCRTSAVLTPPDVGEARQCLFQVLETLRACPDVLFELMNQTAWPAANLLHYLNDNPSPWGGVPALDEGDDIPYLIAFLVRLLALLEHADTEAKWVVYAQQYAAYEPRITELE